MPDAADVVIVGGGVIGLATAYHLSLAGARVTVLEQRQVGGQASGAAAGIVEPAPGDSPLTALTAASLSILTPWVSTAAELRHLQGSWEGVSEGHEAEGKVSITVTGNTLYFRGLKPTQRYAATVTLPAGTAPQQLHATLG